MKKSVFLFRLLLLVAVIATEIFLLRLPLDFVEVVMVGGTIIVLLAFLFPIGESEALYDRWFKKRRAIRMLTEFIVQEQDPALPSFLRRNDPMYINAGFRSPLRRKEIQSLLDYLLAKLARDAASAFSVKETIRTSVRKKGADLKNCNGWNCMTRVMIDDELERVRRADQKAQDMKAWFNRRRDLVRDAGFEVWDDFEWYLALKIN